MFNEVSDRMPRKVSIAIEMTDHSNLQSIDGVLVVFSTYKSLYFDNLYNCLERLPIPCRTQKPVDSDEVCPSSTIRIGAINLADRIVTYSNYLGRRILFRMSYRNTRCPHRMFIMLT